MRKSSTIRSHGRWLRVALGVAVIAIAVAIKSSADSPSFRQTQPGRMAVGALGGMARVGPSESITTSPTVQLYAARGEYEPFQIAVDAKNGPIESVSVAVSGLRSGDSLIDQSNFTVYMEHYVEIKRSSLDLHGTNRPLPASLYPDALIPVNQAGLTGGHVRFSPAAVKIEPAQRAVFWIDVFVPRQAQPGVYHGSVTVSSQSETATIPVSLFVWRYTLPLRPSLKSSFGINRTRIGDRRMAELLLANRLMPFLIDPARSIDYRKKFGLNASGLWFFGDANVRNCMMNPAPSVQAIRKAMARYPGDVDKYVYAADEIDSCPGMFPTLKQWARNVHEAGAKMLVTVTPTTELLDDGSGTGRSAVDIWVLLPKMYDKARPFLRQILQKGDEIWSYNCLVQDSYSPKWQIDFNPIDYRIQPGYLNQSLGITGLLYWGVDNWNNDPWEDAASLSEGGYTFPGEGLLVYPGADAGVDGPVPSMRLKWLRKGVEDYEYVEMLKRAGRGDWALNLVRSVASDWNSWTQSPAALEGVRRRLGEELDRLEAKKTFSRGGTID